MVVVPALTAVTRPDEELTVATEALELDHVCVPVVASESVADGTELRHRLVVPVIAATEGSEFTVTTCVVKPEQLPLL
jgi:hypothetical protein